MGRARERLYKRGNVWWCWGYDTDGERWSESTHQRDPQAAVLAAREIERRYAADPTHRARSKVTVQFALQQVIDFQAAAGRARGTQRATIYHAEHLVGGLGQHTPLSAVTLDDTRTYLTARLKQGAHRHTIAKELRTLTQAIRRVTKIGLYVPRIAPEHLIPDELGKAYEPRERWLPREEYEALVRALTPVPPGKLQIVAEEKRKRAPRENRADYVIAWCNLGVRKEELSTIQPADYDAARRELRVRGTKTKGADRLIPVNDAAAEVLERRCHNAKPFPSWANCTKKLAETCAKLRLAPVTPNDFRRTFCSWLCQAGVPERICAELLGHGSTVMVRAVYGHLDRASLQRAVALL